MILATNWQGGTGNWADPTRWTYGVPRPGSTVTINGLATITLSGVQLLQEIVSIHETGGASFDLTFNNVTIGTGTTIDAGGQGWLGSLNVTGRSVNAGNINASSGTFGIDVMKGASFVNNRNLTAAPSSPTAWSQLSLMIDGYFQNSGNLIAGARGALTLWSGEPSTSRFANSGTIKADAGSAVTISAPYLSSGYAGVLTNTGHLVDSGTMTINANVNQAGTGDISVQDGGLLNVNGKVTGDTIEIKSTSLQHISRINFGMGRPGTSIPLAAGQLRSELDLTGAALISFNGLHALSPTFSAGTHELVVKALGTDGNVYQIGAFYLGGSTIYKQEQFSVAADGSVMFKDRTHLTP